MEASSSASPTALEHYGRFGAEAGALMEAEARRLTAALAPFLARCREYRVPAVAELTPRLVAYARHEAELGAWVAEIARAFRLADTAGGATPLGPPPVARRQAAEARQTQLWNAEARQVIALIRLIRGAIAAYGLGGVLANPGLITALGAPHAGVVLGLVYVGDRPRRAAGPPTADEDGLLPLIHGFWYESMAHLDPELFRELSAELDALSRAAAAQWGGGQGQARSREQAEALADPYTGALAVSAAQAFPLSARCSTQGAATFRPGPADAMAGDHSGISYFPGEQVRLERLNGATGDYRISIAGLDPVKPAAPNNFEAVALTAQGVRAGNHYYEVVKQRLMADLERMPPGSTLHLQGHSMGGGICLLLRDDPEVQRSIAAAGVTVGSLITFGTVRPRGPAGAPRDEQAGGPFAGAVERHYVNTDDSLARSVGAGHAGDPTVILLDNRQLDDPTAAHRAYGSPEQYAHLAPELLALPYTVDPATYTAYGDRAPAPTQR